MASDPLSGSNNFPTILVAEVDSARRLALADTLSREGYLVLEADDISSALDVARTHSRCIHLLLMSDSLDPSLPALLKYYRPNLHVLRIPEGRIALILESILENVRQFFSAPRKMARAAGSPGAAA